jgi:hypothetical protein
MTDRAGRWLRVSGDTQSEEDQEPEINAYCADRGYGYENGPLFVVHGKSAYKGAQDPDWQKVVAAFKNHEIDVIVLWMVDRLDRRNVLHAVPMVNAVLEVGGRVEFSEQPECNLDASDPDLSDKVEAFAKRCADAHRESKIKSKRVKKTFNRIDGNGAIRNRAGYGHRITGEKYSKRFELDEAEADVIRLAVSRYLSGQSLVHICRWLTTKGHYGRNGAAWTPKTLGKVFRSETLIGRYHQGDTVARVPSIITVKQWNAAQAKLNEKAYRKGVRTRPDTALLTSILYCGKCGRAMYRFTGRVNQPVVYYCRPRAGVPSCKMLIPMKQADEMVILEIGEQIYVKNRTEEITIPGHDYADDIEQVVFDIKALDPKDPEWLARATAMQAEIARLAQLPPEADVTETREVDTVAEANAWQQLPMAAKRQQLLDWGIKLYAAKDADGNITISQR